MYRWNWIVVEKEVKPSCSQAQLSDFIGTLILGRRFYYGGGEEPLFWGSKLKGVQCIFQIVCDGYFIPDLGNASIFWKHHGLLFMKHEWGMKCYFLSDFYVLFCGQAWWIHQWCLSWDTWWIFAILLFMAASMPLLMWLSVWALLLVWTNMNHNDINYFFVSSVCWQFLED